MLNKKKLIKKIVASVIIIAFIFLVMMEITLRLAGAILLYERQEIEASHESNDTFIILTIGESTTYGLGVKPEESYPKQLERILNERTNKSILVLNAGVPGTTSSAVLRGIDAVIQKNRPDLVIILLGANENNPRLVRANTKILFNFVYFPEWIYSLRTVKLFLVSKDVIFNYGFRREKYNDFFDFYDPSPEREGNFEGIQRRLYWRQFQSNYDAIIKKVKNYDANVVIISYLHMDFHDEYTKLSRENNVLYVSLLIPKENRTKDLFLEDNFHPTQKGHRMMAEHIADELIKKNLIRRSKVTFVEPSFLRYLDAERVIDDNHDRLMTK